MASKDYPKAEAQANQQSQQTSMAQSGADTSQILTTLTQVFSTFQKQLQNQPPREFAANALTAASAFNDIVAGLELRPLKNLPDLKNAQTVSSTEIKLEWEWTDADGYTAQGFKIWRCEGPICQNFVEISAPLASDRSYTNTGLSSGTTYRYMVSATTSGGERFSQIAQATT